MNKNLSFRGVLHNERLSLDRFWMKIHSRSTATLNLSESCVLQWFAALQDNVTMDHRPKRGGVAIGRRQLLRWSEFMKFEQWEFHNF